MNSFNGYKIDNAEVTDLFKKHAFTKSNEIRDKIILMHQDFVKSVVRKFVSEDIPLENLISLGNIGLIQAVDRYDLNRGVQFTTYAYALIEGEVRNYLRDRPWQMKMPKRVREQYYRIQKTIDLLTQRLRRSPTIPEISLELNLPEDLILEIVEAEQARSLLPIDASLDDEYIDDESSLGTEWVGAEDKELRSVIDRLELDFAMSKLSKQQKAVIILYYYQDFTQKEIADRLGISQMQVSRLQRQAITTLKEYLTED